MSTFTSPAITEVVGDKDQGGPPTNSDPVAIASDMPAAMIDLPTSPGVFGPPDDDNNIVVDRGSKRGRTRR
jgi:hypothetical protein